MVTIGPYNPGGDYQSIIETGVYCVGTANESSWYGRVADVQLSSISSFSDCATPPTDVTTPTDPQMVWQVNAADGNDSSPNGPWQTIAGLAAHLLDQTVLPRYPAWVDPSGDPEMYANLPNTASKEALVPGVYCRAAVRNGRHRPGPWRNVRRY